MNKDALIAAVKETARVAVLAAASAAVAYLLQWIGVQDQTNIIVIIGTLLLRGADKYVHQNENINRNGIVPF